MAQVRPGIVASKIFNDSRWHHLLCNSYLVVSLFPCSYHKLMVVKYCSKLEKFQEAKQRSAVERRLVCKLERAMDVDLFLEMQSKWAKDSPHHLVILHKMFCHATTEGWKEAEWIVHWGHWQHMPQLNPEAGVLAIELVGPEPSREELLELYLEVYKLHWLPGSPPGELGNCTRGVGHCPRLATEKGRGFSSLSST